MTVPLEDQPVWLVINNPLRNRALNYDVNDYKFDNDEDASHPKQSRWTEEEGKKLLQLRDMGKSNSEIAEILNRTEQSVTGKISYFKGKGIITRDIRVNWSGKELNRLMELTREGKSPSEIGKEMNRTMESVRSKIIRLQEQGVKI